MRGNGFLFLLLFSCSTLWGEEFFVVYGVGEPSVVRKGSGVKVTPFLPLEIGDLLNTRGEDRLKISVEEEYFLLLQGNTEIVLDLAPELKRKFQIHLHYGTIRLVGKGIDPLVTPSFRWEMKEGDGIVTFLSGESFEIFLQEGEGVYIPKDGERRILRKGERVSSLGGVKEGGTQLSWGWVFPSLGDPEGFWFLPYLDGVIYREFQSLRLSLYPPPFPPSFLLGGGLERWDTPLLVGREPSPGGSVTVRWKPGP